MNKLETLLLVEDDKDVRHTIARVLEHANFRILEASSGTECMEQLETGEVDIAVVDLGLPDIDGLDLVRTIRAWGSVGVLILSGRQETVDKVIGIELGADDYLTKPFDNRELVSRIKSIARRLPKNQRMGTAISETGDVYEFDGWKLFEDRHALIDPQGQAVELTSGEFELLLLFLKSPGRVLSRNQIMDGLYGDRTPAFDRSVDVRIGRLRKKITFSASELTKIKTIRNAGYLFCAKVVCA